MAQPPVPPPSPRGCELMQNLKRNWHVSTKLTRGIWQILNQALRNLKHLHFNGLLLTNVCNVWVKKTEKLCLMTLKIDAKFEGKLTYASKGDMRNLANFHRLKNICFILQIIMVELNQNMFTQAYNFKINKITRSFIIYWYNLLK